MTKIQSIIERTASKEMQFHAFAKEWQSAIISVWALKFFTAIVSVYAGAGYLAALLIGSIGNIYAGWFAAMILLFLLETVNATALFKGFKFALRKRVTTALIALFVSIGSFGCSFYISVNGIAQMQSEKVDNTAEIQATQANLLSQQETEINAQIADQKANIELIKSNPQGWQGGKREVLTSTQLNQIAGINAQIADLTAQRTQARQTVKTETNNLTAANKQAANSEGAKYYRLVSILMFIQLLANFALTFFYAKIYTETEKQKAENEDIEAFAQGLFANMYSDVKTRYANLQNTFVRKANEIFENVANAPVNTPLTPNAQNAQNTPVNTPLTPPKSGGIGFQNRSVQNTQPQNVAHATQPENVNETANYYFTHRPQLCDAIGKQSQGQIFTTNRELARIYNCSEATVRNCRRAIITQ